MTNPDSAHSPAQQPSAVLALLVACVIGMVTPVLFRLVEAGPGALFMPAFPLVTGGLGLGAARYSVRTWHAIGSSLPGGGARRGFRLTLTFVALLIDLVVIGSALIVALMMVFGTGIA